MIATRCHASGDQPSTATFPSPTTRIGAIATIGIVCDATTYGITPRCRTPKRAITAPSAKPINAPKTKPTTASFAVKSAAWNR